MAGLLLGGSAQVRGTYNPLTPASAQSSTSGANTIGQVAYGISGSGVASDRKVAGYGSVGAGLVGLALLAWLWYSLPS